jgi:cytochrome c peroxidase
LRRFGLIVWFLYLASAGVGAEDGALPSRDAVWRSIFTRPVDASAPSDPASAEKVSLGHDLFRDARLSGDGARSCASCHDPAKGYTNGKPKGEGLGGIALPRNVPAIYNLAWSKQFFWDGRAASLEAQARFPLLAHDELASDFALMIARLTRDPLMRERFMRAFPDRAEISERTILAAIAAYERTLVSPPSRFDRWVSGDDEALTETESEGFDLFVGKAGCVACHGGWRFTDDAFHDIGLKGGDPGRGAVEGGVPGLAQFKTPSLRELTYTAPYMHDGSLPDLRAVVDHYAGGLVPRPSLDANVVRELTLTESEKTALISFLRTLSTDAGPPHRD